MNALFLCFTSGSWTNKFIRLSSVIVAPALQIKMHHVLRFCYDHLFQTNLSGGLSIAEKSRPFSSCCLAYPVWITLLINGNQYICGPVFWQEDGFARATMAKGRIGAKNLLIFPSTQWIYKCKRDWKKRRLWDPPSHRLIAHDQSWASCFT